MARPNPAGLDWVRIVLTLGLIGAPVAISYLGWRWRAVEQQVTALYLKRLAPGTRHE